MDALDLGRGKGELVSDFAQTKNEGLQNPLSTCPFQATASYLASSASGRLLISSPHEAALMSSCTSAPGSLTSLFLMSGCQDTGGKEVA